MPPRRRRGVPGLVALAVAGATLCGLGMHVSHSYARLSQQHAAAKAAATEAAAQIARLESRVAELSAELSEPCDEKPVVVMNPVAEDPFDCYFEDCAQKAKKEPAAAPAEPLWRRAATSLGALEAYMPEIEDASYVDASLERGIFDALPAVQRACKKRAPEACARTANEAAEVLRMRLASELDDKKTPEEQCLTGRTKREQMRWVKDQKQSRVVVAVVTHETTCDYPRLELLRSFWSAARTAGYNTEGSFVFACGDAAALAAACAAGLPAVAASSDVAEDADSLLRSAHADARLRQGRRLLSETSGSPLEDAALFEALLADSTFSKETKDVEKPVPLTLPTERGTDVRRIDALRFDTAAELATKGIPSLYVDVASTFWAPPVGKHRARHALDLALEAPKQKKGPRRPGVRVATRQGSTRVPCPAVFAADAGNASATLLKRLAKLSRTTVKQVEFTRALATELRLGSAAPGALGLLTVACAPRPRFVVAERHKLGAVVLQMPQANIASLRALASELGLLSLSNKEGKYVALRDGALHLDDPRTIYRSTRFARLIVAYLVAVALVTGRSLVLPSLHVDERVFFLWSYLDTASLDALGVQWTHATFLTQFDTVAELEVSRTRATLHVDYEGAKVREKLDAWRHPWADDRLWRFAQDERLEDADMLVLHLPFVADDYAKRLIVDSAYLSNPARIVAAHLAWCDKGGLHANNDARVATAASSCWGKGVILDPAPDGFSFNLTR